MSHFIVPMGRRVAAVAPGMSRAASTRASAARMRAVAAVLLAQPSFLEQARGLRVLVRAGAARARRARPRLTLSDAPVPLLPCLRELRGTLLRPEGAEPVVMARHDGARGELVLQLGNPGQQPITLRLQDLAHGQPPQVLTLAPGQQLHYHWSVAASHHWYDLLVQADGMSGFARRLAGHVENGLPSYCIT